MSFSTHVGEVFPKHNKCELFSSSRYFSADLISPEQKAGVAAELLYCCALSRTQQLLLQLILRLHSDDSILMQQQPRY